jgi:pyruvate formate lyase activating enzyme
MAGKMGLIFNIQRFSIHDGPGIRTTVFLQGCNLRCFWCHNPESQPVHPVVEFFPDKCILCGRCAEVCPQGAQQIDKDQHRLYFREQCQLCGKCVDDCFARALVRPAREMTVEEVLAEIHKDRDYYNDSGGGVTFSGGEPFLQTDFLLELLMRSKRAGFHTAVDTAGNIPFAWIDAARPYTDLFLYDCKVIDDDRHKELTGVSNRLILENLRRLAEGQAHVWVRVPVVPGLNDTVEDIQQIGEFLVNLPGVEQVELLPFHHLGAVKYESLGRGYLAKGLKPPSEEWMDRLLRVMDSFGITARRMV